MRLDYISQRFLCRPTAFFSTCWSRGTSESSTYQKQRICTCNSALAHFHVSWLLDSIFYQKPLYKTLHQSFFYSFITILPSESGPLQHDFALDPIIPPFDFHFRIYKRDLAILTEWWRQRIAWWERINAACQIIWSIICIRKQHSNRMEDIHLSVFCRTNSSIYRSKQSRRK